MMKHCVIGPRRRFVLGCAAGALLGPALPLARAAQEAPDALVGRLSNEVLDAVRKITLEAPVIGMDVVEVSPPYDHADITALLASRVALEALSALAKKQGGEKHDPGQPLLSNR